MRSRLLLGLVAIQAVISVGYGLVWMYYAQIQTASSTLGIVAEYDDRDRLATVTTVEGGSPAQAAGLTVGDRVRSASGMRLSSRARFLEWDRTAIDEDTVLVVLRNGQDAPLLVKLARVVPFSFKGLIESSLLELLTFYPVVFLGVGLAVLLLRPMDSHAWLMALLFASFISVPTFPRATSGLPPWLASFVLGYRAVGLTAIPAFFYAFFTRFPVRSPLDLRFPWLRWLNAAGVLLFGVTSIHLGGPQSPSWMVRVIGESASDLLRLAYLFAGIPLGVAALFLNAWGAPTPDARRKAKVLLWGTAAGAMPLVIQSASELLLDLPTPTWAFTAALMMSSILPLSFAYAVVKHRVLDVPVLLKRSARYLLVRRGIVVLLLAMASLVTAIFTPLFSRVAAVSTDVAVAVSVAFGIALGLGSLRLLRQATRRIDRAFFRRAYDAATVLEQLADRLRTSDSREALARLLATHIVEALAPAEFAVFLADHTGTLRPYEQRWPFPLEPPAADAPWVVQLQKRGRIWDVSARSQEEVPDPVRASTAELLVPILSRDGALSGYIVLGSRRSEEPYSGEDRRLLTSVANQAGVELENIRLAETIAERLDAERAVDREMALALQVQARLFPQARPPLATLDYAGGCLQARAVGGDYYDFLSTTPDRLLLVIADTSGKGIGGALMMAHLQANLRAQYRSAPDDLEGLLAVVNRQFWENSGENQYATLILAEYADTTRTLRVANCGHFPGFVLHADGRVRELSSTATVIGLFPEWQVQLDTHTLAPGDQLLLYTDGVIEARNPAGEEFGTERMLEVVRAHTDHPVGEAVTAVHDAVRAFCGGPAEDDVTVLLARVR